MILHPPEHRDDSAVGEDGNVWRRRGDGTWRRVGPALLNIGRDAKRTMRAARHQRHLECVRAEEAPD